MARTKKSGARPALPFTITVLLLQILTVCYYQIFTAIIILITITLTTIMSLLLFNNYLRYYYFYLELLTIFLNMFGVPGAPVLGITYHLPGYVWCPWCPCPGNVTAELK